MRHRCRWQTAALAVFLVFLLLLTLKNANYTANGIKKGLVLFGNMLLPSLLPFLVLSELFLASGTGEWLGRVLARPLRALFGLTESGAAALLLGWLCGVPVGTVYAVNLYRRGEIGTQELRRLLLLANTPSTGFLVSAVGLSLFGSREAGAVLLVATLAATLLSGVLIKLLRGNIAPQARAVTTRHTQGSTLSMLTGAVKNSAQALLTILGFVLFFAAVSECVSAASDALSLPPLVATLLTGTLELSAGVRAATAAHTPQAALVLCALFSGFSGLSIALQVFTVSEGCDARLLPYLLIKAAQGLVAAGLTALYLFLTRPQLSCTQANLSCLAPTLSFAPLITWQGVIAVLAALLLLPPLLRARTVHFYKIK